MPSPKRFYYEYVPSGEYTSWDGWCVFDRQHLDQCGDPWPIAKCGHRDVARIIVNLFNKADRPKEESTNAKSI